MSGISTGEDADGSFERRTAVELYMIDTRKQALAHSAWLEHKATGPNQSTKWSRV